MGKWDISLSYNKLKLLVGDESCPRCFFDANKLKLERPRQIFPSLPNGMDDALKVYCDQYRGRLPPMLKGLLPGTLWNGEPAIAKFRHWRSNHAPLIPTPYGTVSLIGAFDDLLQRDDGFVSIIDYKTRGSRPDAGYYEKWYSCQADLYHVQLKLAGRLTPHPETFFLAFSPQECDADYDLPDGLPVKFDVTLQSVIAHYEDGMDLIHEGAKILSGKRPDPGVNCAFCSWAEAQHLMMPAVDPNAPVMT